MENVLALGLEAVRAVQGLASPALTLVMKALSFLGSEYFYLAVLPLAYWCVDRRRGARLGVVFLASTFLNLWIKDLLLQPRPFHLDPAVKLADEVTPGFPSNHAQGTAVFWGLAAPMLGGRAVAALSVLLVLLVGLSRVYLGVHFPTDVLGGWVLAALVLLADRLYGDKVVRLLGRAQLRVQAALVAFAALAMNALDMRDTSIAGVFFGAGLGFVFARRLAPFSSGGGLGEKCLRYLAGIATTALAYLLPKLLLPGEGSELHDLFRFARYALVGAWVGLGAPWLFLRMGLARREEGAERGEGA